MLTILLLIALGILAGVLSGLLGIGGGILIVPALMFAFGLSQKSSNATTLVSLLLPVGALGVWQYYRSGFLGKEQIYWGLWIALGIFCGAFMGARISTKIPEIYLQRIFAVFLLLVAARLWWMPTK